MRGCMVHEVMQNRNAGEGRAARQALAPPEPLGGQQRPECLAINLTLANSPSTAMIEDKYIGLGLAISSSAAIG